MSGRHIDPEEAIREWLSDSAPRSAPDSVHESLEEVKSEPAGHAGRTALTGGHRSLLLAGRMVAAVALLVIAASTFYLYGSARPTSSGRLTSTPSMSAWPSTSPPPTAGTTAASTATETTAPTSQPPPATITHLNRSSWSLVDGALSQTTNTAAGSYQKPIFALPSGGFVAFRPTASGETRVFASGDGLSWNELPKLPVRGVVISDVTEEAGTIVAVGQYEGQGPAVTSAMLATFDGQAWSTDDLTPADGSAAYHVAHGPAGFLISGSGPAGLPLWSSATGTTWTQLVESGIPSDADQPVLLGNSKGYTAVQLFNPMVWHSTDGAHWTETYHAPALTGISSYYMGPIIKTADGGYRSFGGIYTGTGLANATPEDMVIWTSPDMTHWTMSATVKTIGFPGLFVNGGVAPIAGGFAAAGTQPSSLATRGPLAAWTSRDGKSWQKLAGLPSLPDSLVLEVAGDGTHVVVAFVDGQEHFELLVGAGLE